MTVALRPEKEIREESGSMAAVRERTSGREMRSGRSVQGRRGAEVRAQVQSGRSAQSSGRVQSGRSTQTGRQARSGRSAQAGHARSSRYIQGSAVRKLDVAREIELSPKKKLSNTARKNREKAEHMSLGYVLFLSIALFATGCILVGYIGLQSDITNSIKRIASLERELNDLKLANDEEYNRITSSVDLEEVRKVAIQELGMQYAEEGQIVVFESENNDYVKQIAAIPD